MYINLKKSESFLEEIQYLGHIISKSSIRMDPKKLDVIKEWPPVLKNICELRSFIGMCAYYCRFIAHFSSIVGPLHDLTKKNVRFIWLDKQDEAFKMLKEKLISPPILVLSNLTKPFEVHCDACRHSLGAMLLQESMPLLMKAGG